MRLSLLLSALLVAGLLVLPSSTVAGPVPHPLKLQRVSHTPVVLGKATLASLR
jgi:hypothetical protein